MTRSHTGFYSYNFAVPAYLIFLTRFQKNIIIFLWVYLIYQPGSRYSELGEEMHESEVCKNKTNQNDGWAYPTRGLEMGAIMAQVAAKSLLPFLVSHLSTVWCGFRVNYCLKTCSFLVYARDRFRIVHNKKVSQETPEDFF